jgi:hypothetical protein
MELFKNVDGLSTNGRELITINVLLILKMWDIFFFRGLNLMGHFFGDIFEGAETF